MLALAAPVCAAPLEVVVTLTDLVPLVRAVGGDEVTLTCIAPAGGDPHSFTISPLAAGTLRSARLVVFAGSEFLEFENEIKRGLDNTPVVDWPDYMAEGARLHDVPGLPANPHGLWLELGNGIAIARAVGRKLVDLGASRTLVRGNVAGFVSELQAARATGVALAQANGTAGQTLVAVVPGVADCILNLGMKVGKVLLPTEGASFASGQDVQEAVARLRSGAWGGLVCPLGLRDAKPGEIARQVAQDAHCRVIYVRFLGPVSEESSYLAQAYYNAGVLATAGAQPPNADRREGGTDGRARPGGMSARASAASVALAALVVILLLVVALLNTRRIARTAAPGAGIFDDLEERD